MCLIHCIGGAFRHQPEQMAGSLSDGARRLMDRKFEDVDPSKRPDYHVHVVGLGTNNSGMSVNRKMLSWWYPMHCIRAAVYLSGANVTDRNQADQQYADRLASLIRNIEGVGKAQILAFDHHYNQDGTINQAKTNFYTPNEWVFSLNEIYHYNPLLFDYVLKRTVQAPGTRERLSASIFQANPTLDPQVATGLA